MYDKAMSKASLHNSHASSKSQSYDVDVLWTYSECLDCDGVMLWSACWFVDIKTIDTHFNALCLISSVPRQLCKTCHPFVLFVSPVKISNSKINEVM